MSSKSSTNFFIARFSVAAELIVPNGIFKNSYDPSGVTNAVLGMFSSGTVICQYPLGDHFFVSTKLLEQMFGIWHRLRIKFG